MAGGRRQEASGRREEAGGWCALLLQGRGRHLHPGTDGCHVGYHGGGGQGELHEDILKPKENV